MWKGYGLQVLQETSGSWFSSYIFAESCILNRSERILKVAIKIYLKPIITHVKHQTVITLPPFATEYKTACIVEHTSPTFTI